MKITREQLKSIVREVLTEENEYQAFFKKALEKAGKSIPNMSDEEKKAFFNKIDAAWQGKGEKNERFGRDKVGPAFGDEFDSKGEDDLDDIEDLDESTINEGFMTIAIGTWVVLYLLKILARIAIIGPYPIDKELSKDKLHKVTERLLKIALKSPKLETEKAKMLRQYLKDQIDSGKIKSIKDLQDTLEKASKTGIKVKESVKEEKVNEGFLSIVLGVSLVALLLKLLGPVVNKVVGKVLFTKEIPKDKLIKIINKLTDLAIKRATGDTDKLDDFRNLAVSEIKAGRVKTVKDILMLLTKLKH